MPEDSELAKAAKTISRLKKDRDEAKKELSETQGEVGDLEDEIHDYRSGHDSPARAYFDHVRLGQHDRCATRSPVYGEPEFTCPEYLAMMEDFAKNWGT